MRQALKKNGGVTIIGILTVVAHLFLALYGDPEDDLGDTIDLSVPGATLPDLLDATGKNIVPVEINSTGIIRHGGRLELMGELDFDARVGDVLLFRKVDDRWVEVVGRSLAGEDDDE